MNHIFPDLAHTHIFTTTGNVAQVKYAKLIFSGAYQQYAILQELRFCYYRGPLADTEVCDYILIGDLDRNCRVDFYDIALMAGNWLVDCMGNSQNPECLPG